MQGLNSISEAAIADSPAGMFSPGITTGSAVGEAIAVGVPGPQANSTGHAVGVAVVAGVGRRVAGAAGAAVGSSLVQGQTFITGSALASRTQLFDFSVNILQTLLWQYNTADALLAWMEGKQEWYDTNQQDFWESWFHDVFDLRTANDFGCAVWAIILGLPLNIIYTGNSDKNWGFAPHHVNFNRGNFGSSTPIVLALTLAQKRLVLELRYYQLITRGTVPDINRNFARIFAPFGSAYVIDNYDMTMTYVFDFDISSPLAFILKFYRLLPAPAGVKVNFLRRGQSAGRAVGAAVVQGVT